jgi:exonuclease SbcC
MRPARLTLEGFRSYAGRTTFDWTDRRLVGIVGPTGSGKSSILDAIAFALYGRTPTVGRDTGDLVNQRADKAYVELVFSVDGAMWKVQRVIARKGQSQVKLVRLGTDEDDELETIAQRAPVNERIERLLGLPFDGFCRSVLLAQNRFAEFLRATDAERDGVLRGVFGFDQISDAHDEAKRRLDDVRRDLEEFHRMAQTHEADRAALREAEIERDAARARTHALQQIGPAVAGAISTRDSAVARGDDARRRDEEIAAAAELLGDPGAAAAAIAVARDAVGGIRDAEEAVKRAEVDRVLSAEARERAEEAAGGRSALERARELLVRAEQQGGAVRRAQERADARSAAAEAAEKAVASASEELEAARAAEEEARSALDAATAVVAEARVALDHAKHADMAASLRATLAAGDTCPVCDQPVQQLPKVGRRARGLSALERELQRAEKAESKARAGAAAAAARSVKAEGACDAAARGSELAAKQLQEASEELGAARAEAQASVEALDALLGKGDHRAILQEREETVVAAEEAERRAESALNDSRRELDQARSASEVAGTTIQRLASSISAAAGMISRPASVSTDPDEVERALAETRRAIDELGAEARGATTAAAEEAASAVAALDALLAGASIPEGETFEEALTSALVALGTAESRTADLSERVARGSEIDATIADAVAKRDRLTRLVSDLTPARFLKFLLQEERASLAAIGSEHCERLTDGRYRFTLDGSFDVVDLNAAETTRKADSLSGGETFLASLALALALAEMVSRGGGRLDSFFLDEGFGSLDPEHLDLAMDGIERLVADSDRRLVVVVSHVPEMRERIEDLVELRKDPVTGETLVHAGSVPGRRAF